MDVQALIDRHAGTIETASQAIVTREYWSAYPELLKAQPEGAIEAGQRAFDGYLNSMFPLDQPGTDGQTESTERSPFGLSLNVTYPHSDPTTLVSAAQQAQPGW